ncbi:MAG: DUF2314 domain-containing protein [Planctomycetota bacterium]
MIPFLNKSLDMGGSVLFRGAMRPRLAEFESLQAEGFEVTSKREDSDGGWLMKLRHSRYGDATLVCMDDMLVPHPELIDADPWLSPLEAEDVKACGSMVSVMMRGQKKQVLRDRKQMLTVLAAVMSEEGVACLDHQAERFWSRAELQDELSHDADLDIGSLFTTHMVTADGEYGDDEDVPIQWCHTHGLSALGLWDFDILAPGDPAHPGFFDHGRVLAFGMMAGDAKPGGTFDITNKGSVALVDAKKFQSTAASKWTALREHDESHRDKRVVLCEPTGWLSRLLHKRATPSRWLRRPLDETALHQFSTEASDLSAERARNTFKQLRVIAEETKELQSLVIVKIRYKTDASDPDNPEYEHMWHEVHELGDGTIQATLISQPFDVSGVNAGDRRTHGLEDLSDWSVVSPLGMITPRYQTPIRLFREKREEILEILAEAEQSDDA